MLKAFKYRLNPTNTQSILINKHIGACRFVYNLALETKTMAYAGNRVNLSCFDLMKQLPNLKKECDWLREVNGQSLQHAITNLDSAYTAFFKGRNNFPKFKKKSGGGSFNVPQRIFFKNNKLIIPKFTKKNGINIVLHRPIIGTIKSATISRTSTGKYFVSILVDTNIPIPDKKPITLDTSIGIDLGIKSFAVTSNGEKFDNPKYLHIALAKLKYVQRKYSKNKGKRTKQRLALIYEKVANQRKDFLHKLSTKLIRENQTICLEDLNVSGMMQNHCLAQAIGDVGWGMFVEFLTYKADWNGNNILKIGRFAPSSKTCSCCGYINKELTLKDREWTCGGCETTHDRDENAAINVKSFALKKILSGTDKKNQNELPTLMGVLTSEASQQWMGSSPLSLLT